MCGIVGYTGHLQAAPILLDGLSKLEYRGYDSAGLAVRNGEKKTEIVKAKGRLKSLAEKTDNGNALIGTFIHLLILRLQLSLLIIIIRSTSTHQ